MGFLDLLNHLWNFALPALWMATALVLLQRLPKSGRQMALGWRRHWLALFGTGLAALLAGLLWWQQDGRMGTYMGLAGATGLMQAWLVRRYRVK